MHSLKCFEWLGLQDCRWFLFPSEYNTSLLSFKLQFNGLHSLTWILSIKMRTFGACRGRGAANAPHAHPPPPPLVTGLKTKLVSETFGSCVLYLVNSYFTIPKRLMGNLSPCAWVRVSTPSNKCGALRLDYSSLFDTLTPHSGRYITISSDCQDCVFGNFSGKPYKGLEKITFGPSMKPLNIFVSLFWIVLFCFVLFFHFQDFFGHVNCNWFLAWGFCS